MRGAVGAERGRGGLEQRDWRRDLGCRRRRRRRFDRGGACASGWRSVGRRRGCHGLSDTPVARAFRAWAAELSTRGCDLQHSTGGPYGENLYWSSAPSRAQAVVGSWTDEAEHFNARKNKCARGEVCGHYTQVVWADSRTVGCAMASCGAAQVWVCNYDPPGNFVGQKPF